MNYMLEILQYLLEGTKIILLVFSITFVCSIPLGLLGAVLSQSKIKPLVWSLQGYT